MIKPMLAVLMAIPVSAFAQDQDVDLQALWHQCVSNATGNLTVTPSSVDRWTSIDRKIQLSWTVSLPAQCPSSIKIGISPRQEAERNPLPRSGTMSSDPMHRAQWVTLVVSAGTHRKLVDSEFVNVQGDPGTVPISDGPKLTREDIAVFNARWMQPYDINEQFQRVCNNLRDRNDSTDFEALEFTLAMVRMYDLTHDEKYVNALGKVVDHMMTWREDRRRGTRKVDAYREIVASGWGAVGANTGGYYTIGESTSSIFGHAVAAYARIVLESPELRSKFGVQAVEYLNAIGSTANLFLQQQIRYQTHSGHREAALVHIKGVRDFPTDQECVDYAAANPEGITTHVNNCKNLSGDAERPHAYNIQGVFMMMLIEMWRASNTEVYQQSPRKSPVVQQVRTLTPILVSRFQRFFARNLSPQANAGYQYYTWYNADDVPIHRIEDTNHGALTITHIGAVHDNFEALNTVASDWNEALPLGTAELRKFANTFLINIAGGDNFRRNVEGASVGSDETPTEYNGACDGWAMMTAGDPRVFTVCRQMHQRMVSLGLESRGAHAALLKAKRMLPQAGLPDEVVGPFSDEVRSDETTPHVELPACSGDPPVRHPERGEPTDELDRGSE